MIRQLRHFLGSSVWQIAAQPWGTALHAIYAQVWRVQEAFHIVQGMKWCYMPEHKTLSSFFSALKEESNLRPQGRQDAFHSGFSHPSDGCGTLFTRSRSLCYYYQGWSHRKEFNQMHFLMMSVVGQGFISNVEGKKRNGNVCGTFNIRRNSVFCSCFTLLGCFLSAKKVEGNMLKLNEITGKKHGWK